MIVWRKGVDKTLLQPQFLADVEALLGGSPHTWLVTSGHRGIAEQAELYRIYKAGGPKAAPAGKSAHNYGLAIDVVPGTKYPRWRRKLGSSRVSDATGNVSLLMTRIAPPLEGRVARVDVAVSPPDGFAS